MERNSLGNLAPPRGPIPRTGYTVISDGDHYAFASQRYPDREIDLNLAFGSGKTGMTYVLAGATRMSEAQMSFFPHLRKWYVTPGHKVVPDSMLGQAYDGSFPRQCVKCHSVSLADNTLLPQTKFFGVGCEACHGPGSAHIAAARRKGSADLEMEKIEKWAPKRINDLCAKCHVPPTQPDGTVPQTDETHRFQPIGIMKSACFVKSGEALSCSTCHDPHTDVSTDKQHYEKVCLSCHSARAGVQPVSQNLTKGRSCPVNPRTDCVACHMPPRRIFKDSPVPTYLADHFIRVYKGSDGHGGPLH